MSEFETAFTLVQDLVKTFRENHTHYIGAAYNEADVRKDFIDKFFMAFGWDVNHETQINPFEQEVKIELSQRQQNESGRKRADYAFYLAPKFKEEIFFVEAKKPSVSIQNNEQHYFQTIRYGWNAGCPISILTNFEELVILDCRSKPNIKYVLNAKHKYYTCTDYTNKEKFAEMYWLFSHEAVSNNSIEKYADTMPSPKGKVIQTALFKGGYKPIDEDFLEYIDDIRQALAKAFKKNNESLQSEELTEAVQRTVDRLVFIRFLEDKFIEVEEHVNEWRSWKEFVVDCKKLDAKYNGVVFKKHFIDDEQFSGPEEKMFLDICQDSSNFNSPYDFNYFPIHILGSIYERFLGKVVIATEKRIHIDEKPEVRKAGGIYYTPKYIVDYIVQNTVGKLIEGQTPKQIAELRFADIACGSGSFLIGVYEWLLEYHKKYYIQKFANKTELDKRNEEFENIEFIDGQWRLTLKLKQDILLNNIYGVDIDSQAVEVTQLSLFLKLLEDETLSTTQARQNRMFSKVLPDLTKNIQCGNSLIGLDITDGQLFENAELKKLNPFDFKTAFPKVFARGGFDAIVGNPPYVDYRAIDGNQINYLNKKYSSTQTNEKWSLYIVFIEKSKYLLNLFGKFGYIIPNTFLSSEFGKPLRNLLLNQTFITEITDVSTLKVFGNVGTYPVLFFYQLNKTSDYIKLANTKNEKDLLHLTFSTIKQSDIIKKNQNYVLSTAYTQKHFKLIMKIEKDCVYLKDIIEKFAWGTSIVGFKSYKISQNEYEKLPLNKKKNYAKVIQTADIKSYCITWKKEFITTSIYSEKIKSYFNENKIVIARLTKKIQATIDNEKYFMGKSSFIISSKVDMKVLIALLNSNLLNYFFTIKFTNTHLSGGYLRFDIPYLTMLPIKVPNKQNEIKFISLVEKMLEAKKKFHTATTEAQKNMFAHQCKSLDNQINALVYELYDVTEEEIKTIEGTSDQKA